MKHGKWLVVGDKFRSDGTHYKIPCRCECGTYKEVDSYTLRRGKSTQCGVCSRKNGQPKHSMANTVFYKRWSTMNSRCKNGKSYIERGIKVEWVSFEEFMKDMYDTFDKSLEIDRIDNDGNYCKSNCRWIPKANNLGNKSNNSKYGVGIYKQSEKFRAMIYSGNKVVYSEAFDSINDAVNARNAYIIEHSLDNRIQEVA